MGNSLIDVAVQITRAFVPLIIILGVLTNSLNIIILRRPNLKRYGCTFYFVALSISNLCYSIFITYNLLLDGYRIDLVRHSSFFCKLTSYFLNFCPHLSVYMLVLASIDRYCSSSLNDQRRRLCNVRTARRAILIVLIITSIFTLGNAIIFDAHIDDTIGCASNSNSRFSQIFLIMQVIVYVIISPFLMMLFGLLTIHNTNQLNRNHLIVFRYRPSEQELARMLIVQVSVHILLSLPFLVMSFMLILPIPFQSTIMFVFLFVIFKIPFYTSFITPFFLYILSAKIYRNELITILKKLHRIRGNITIYPMAHHRGTIPMNT